MPRSELEAAGSRLLRSGGVKTASTAAVALVGLAASAVLARALDQDGLGLFALVLAMVQIGTMLADGGTGLATTRFLAAVADDGAREPVLRAGLRARLLTTTVAIGLGAALMAWLLGALFHGSLSRNGYLWALLLIALKTAFLFAPAVARGRQRWAAEGGLLVLESVAILAAYASLFAWPGDAGALVARLSVAYIALLVPATLVARGSNGGATPSITDGAPNVRRLLAFGLPLVLNSSFFLLLTWTDRVLLGIMCSPADLAVYFIAANLAGAGRLLFGIPEQVLYSHLAAGYRPGAPGLYEIHARIFRLFAVLGALFVVVAGAAGTFAIPLVYGNEYAASVWPFQLLLFVLLIRVMSIPASLLLIVVHERTTETRDALGFAFVVNILVDLILIPRLGMIGAVVGSLVAFSMATLYLWRSLWKIAGLRADGADLARSLLPALAWLAVTIGSHRQQVPTWANWGLQAVLAGYLGLQAARELARFSRLRATAAATP